MKRLFSLATITLLLGTPALAQTMDPVTIPPNPEEVSYYESDASYHQNGTSALLFVSDADPVGRSVCNRGCSSAWVPVQAPAADKRIGNWSVVTRDDGTFQWALKGKPVYVRYHELHGVAPTAGWHALTRTYADALPHR